VFHLVAIAASAGGLSALTELLARLPAGFPAPVMVVQHLDPHHPSSLAHILSRSTPLSVRSAEQDDVLTPGVVYVAPPARHLEVGPDRRVQLTRTARVHFSRPSADRLFESGAAACSPMIGVVLTGAGSDGASGAVAIKAAGGIVIAQDAATSEFFGMPGAAILAGAVDFVLPLESIAPALIRLLRTASS
jgi:two-component system, chemotaxis family, protein-glutamate methylesterase/glutaminase